MYHDSDDEAVSGDETGDVAPSRCERSVVGRSRNPSTTRGRRKAAAGWCCPVIVVDYDLTLVDRSSRPFPRSHEFIEKLSQYNDGHNQLILYSHGSPAYIDAGLAKHYEHERKYFDEIIADSSARNNKPVTHVRRVIKRMDRLSGPRSNLDGDQYDVVIDVTRMTSYDPRGSAVSVDYDTCFLTLEKGVRAFLATKKND
ncbi:hypothetical protein J6590_088229 [Homalodisca vitripennis]|nr:hypothetical protein J6590_088229 [Homalodisca vitripennis]